jgi:hypothetical protein
MVFQNMRPSGLGDTVQNSEVQPPTLGKCSGNMEGFATVMLLITVARMRGHCVVYCLKTFVARAGLKKQWLHSTVNWRVNVFAITSSMNCTN